MFVRFRQWWEIATPYLTAIALAAELAVFLLLLACILWALTPIPAKIIAFSTGVIR